MAVFVRAPMEELVADLAAEFGEGKLSRPFRHLRFSKDKSPYKTSIYAVLAGSAYVSLSATGLHVGRGRYMMDTGQLDRYRRAVVDDASGAELEGAVAAVDRAGLAVESVDTLKTAPPGCPKDHPRGDLFLRSAVEPDNLAVAQATATALRVADAQWAPRSGSDAFAAGFAWAWAAQGAEPVEAARAGSAAAAAWCSTRTLPCRPRRSRRQPDR